MVSAPFDKGGGASVSFATLAIYGVGLLLAFALTVLLAWWAPAVGWGLLIVPAAQFAFGKDYSLRAFGLFVFIMLATVAALFTAAALR